MKTTIFTLATTLVLLFSTVVTAQKTEKPVTQSKIEWEGKKITGSHEGTIQLKEGKLAFDGNNLVGGEFIIDMTTINVTDLSGGGKDKLEGHLKSDDFFGVDNHPTSKLVIKSANKTKEGYYINADITIKGVTQPIAFEMEVEGNRAEAELKIDRTKFDVRYGSGSLFANLGDNTIYDNFEIEIEFTF